MGRLLFFWKEKYGNNSFDYGDGINLSGKYLIKKKSDRLNIQLNSRYVDDFWGNRISDVQVLVGENGSGKTTVVKDLISCLLSSVNNGQVGFIIVAESDNGTITIYDSSNLLSRNNIRIQNGVKCDYKIITNISELGKEYHIGYLTNQLSAIDYFIRTAEANNYMDASLGGRIREYHSNALSMHYTDNYKAELAYYFWEDNFKILKNIVKIADSNDINLRIGNKTIQDIVTTLEVREAFVDYANVRIRKAIGIIPEAFKEMYHRASNLMEKIAFRILQNVVLELCESKIVPSSNDEQREKVLDYLQHELQIALAGTDQDLFGLERKAIREISEIFKYDNKKYNEAVDLLSEITFLENRESHNYITVNVADHYSELKKLVSLYEKTYFQQPYLQIDFGISAGEFCLLRLISDLYELKEKFAGGQCKNIVIFLDEPDNGLHFRWQRLLMVWINDLCDSFFKGKNVQVVMTTHSPILLSDIPDYSVTYVDKMSIKELSKKTFASNIHGLFLDSFFLDQDGVIGEYAKTKVNQLAKELETMGNNIGIMSRRMFDLIGDEYLLNGLSHISRVDIDFQHISNNDNREEMLKLLMDQERKIQELIRLVERR